MSRIVLFCFIIINVSALCQKIYFIKEQAGNTPIPFVKVTPDSGIPFLADIDGMISLPEQTITIRLHQTGYIDTLIELSRVQNFTILMNNQVRMIHEVDIAAGENPAHRIIEQAIKNRKKNNPMDNDAFRYNSYSKFIFDIDREKLAAIPDTTTDSTLIELRRFFSDKHLFILENASTRTFVPPARDKEEITAYKVSGFNDPMFSTFANNMQSFSFYENQFQLLGKTYINPIALGGINRYHFVLEDTTIINKDTTFTIFYRPRKGKNFDGMTGRLYINTNGFAIEKVTASPYEQNGTRKVEIVQEYALVNNHKWFPSKLSTEIYFDNTVSIETMEVSGKGSTYITHVELNPEGIRKRDFDNTTVSMADGAEKVDNQTWDSLRVYHITDKESKTYTALDSISNAEKLDKKLRIFKILSTGKIPMGYVSLDLNRLINFDKFEGYRLGLGLETSDKVSKHFVLGTYGAWGTLDKAFKYGTYSTIYLNKKKGFKLDLRYQQDVIERGGNSLQKDVFSLNSTALYRHFFIQNMEMQRLAEIAVSRNIRSNLKVTLLTNYQRVWFSDGYHFQPSTSFSESPLTQCDLSETVLEFSWNMREKVMQLGDLRVSKGSKYPKTQFKIAKLNKNIAKVNFDYWRLFLDIRHTISIRGVGVLMWNLCGSQTVGNVPLFLMQVSYGTGFKWHVSAPNSFETVRPAEFYHTRQAALFTRFQFNPIKTKAKWNEPQFGIHHAMGYGNMIYPKGHSVTFKSMDKGLFEVGALLNNLFVSKTSGMGIGLFYRYGYYASTNAKENLIPKITANFLF
jgi:hypothetical protein